MSLRVIPVLDVRQGLAVHAVGGDRAHYRPLRSVLHPDPDPIGLARAYRDELGLREIYLADLDAIAGADPNVALYRELHALGCSLWVDAGTRDALSVPPLLEVGVSTIVAGLETVLGPGALGEVLDLVGPDRLVFSLDLRAGVPMVAEGVGWGTREPLAIVESAIARGVCRVLLLDVSRVGTGGGTGTEVLLRRLAPAHPDVEIAVGGGIARADDLLSLEAAGAAAVLIGSALHDGRIRGENLAARPPL